MSDPRAAFSPPRHGGALLAASRRFGIAVERWLDLSTGINPEPYPLPAIPAADWQRLPDPERLDALITAARGAYGVSDGTDVVPVPGTDLAMRLIPRLLPPDKVAILSPTYSGHAEAWRAAGHTVIEAGNLEAAAAFPAIVLANPNNPDGRQYPPEVLAALAASPHRRLLLVDEAFCDLTPELSFVPRLPERTVVLRSFGKFYGLAGLRLGFAIGDSPLLGALRGMLGDWPLSGPAITTGVAALTDQDWKAATRRRLAADRTRLDALLHTAGFGTIEGTDLFRSVLTPRAAALHEALARRGIWTRIFAGNAARIRIGLPPPDQFARLAEALPEAAAEAAGD